MGRTIPRLVTGERMHLIDGEAWAVVLDGADSEVSQRTPGRLWVSFGGRGAMQARFMPDDWDGHLVIDRTSGGAHKVAVIVEDDVVYTVPVGAVCYKWSTVKIDWAPQLSLMA